MGRLPRGRHGLSPEFVDCHQRERLLVALADVLAEQGYEGTTVGLVSKCAGVSKSDFYKHFEHKGNCFVAAYDDAVDQVRASLLAPCRERGDWASGVAGSLSALLAFLASRPALSRLLLIEGLRAGRDVADCHGEALRDFAACFGESAPEADGDRVDRAIDEAVVGGVASLIARRVVAGETERLEEFLPEIAEFALSPYVGVAEARRIISAA